MYFLCFLKDFYELITIKSIKQLHSIPTNKQTQIEIKKRNNFILKQQTDSQTNTQTDCFGISWNFLIKLQFLSNLAYLSTKNNDYSYNLIIKPQKLYENIEIEHSNRSQHTMTDIATDTNNKRKYYNIKSKNIFNELKLLLLLIINEKSNIQIQNTYEKSTFNHEKSTFDNEKSTFNNEKSTFEIEKSTFGSEKSIFDNKKSTFELQNGNINNNLIEKLIIFNEKYNFESKYLLKTSNSFIYCNFNELLLLITNNRLIINAKFILNLIINIIQTFLYLINK